MDFLRACGHLATLGSHSVLLSQTRIRPWIRQRRLRRPHLNVARPAGGLFTESRSLNVVLYLQHPLVFVPYCGIMLQAGLGIASRDGRHGTYVRLRIMLAFRGLPGYRLFANDAIILAGFRNLTFDVATVHAYSAVSAMTGEVF